MSALNSKQLFSPTHDGIVVWNSTVGQRLDKQQFAPDIVVVVTPVQRHDELMFEWRQRLLEILCPPRDALADAELVYLATKEFARRFHHKTWLVNHRHGLMSPLGEDGQHNRHRNPDRSSETHGQRHIKHAVRDDERRYRRSKSGDAKYGEQNDDHRELVISEA
jgi:hypothetical protein